ncbi:hypothetical protein [Brevundimonas sp. C43]|uniref:hypothetical protein n=1 Tax=Brevundimonas sp. C43 TaxID=3068314 RepID=UPI00273E2EF8|nr:hypothetical protein [Brevundimonas sp. C43]
MPDSLAEQMARVDNVVAIQGRQAMSWFSSLVRRLAPTAPVEASGSERGQVEHLAKTLDRSPEEIRRALANLEAKGLIALRPHARERIRNYQRPAQTVQPWWFGDPAFKGTGLYLRGLPALVPTNRLTPPKPGTPEHKAWSAIHRAPPGPDRWAFRSKTFAGIANAMADQWGDLDGLTPDQRDLFGAAA